MMNTLMRVLRHRWCDETDARRALNDTALERLAAHVAASERRHTGEIRVCVEAGLPLSYLWRGASARERAVSMFGKLKVWDTEDNNGVLIYVLLADHGIEIVADRGVSRQVSDAQFREMTAHMGDAFKQGNYEQGLAQAIDEVTDVLVRHFPAQMHRDNPNELPDQVVLR